MLFVRLLWPPPFIWIPPILLLAKLSVLQHSINLGFSTHRPTSDSTALYGSLAACLACLPRSCRLLTVNGNGLRHATVSTNVRHPGICHSALTQFAVRTKWWYRTRVVIRGFRAIRS